MALRFAARLPDQPLSHKQRLAHNESVDDRPSVRLHRGDLNVLLVGSSQGASRSTLTRRRCRKGSPSSCQCHSPGRQPGTLQCAHTRMHVSGFPRPCAAHHARPLIALAHGDCHSVWELISVSESRCARDRRPSCTHLGACAKGH